MIWEKIVGGVMGEAGQQYIEYKAEKKRLQHERKLEVLRGKIKYEQAKSERAAKSEGYDRDWELASIANSGWTNEFTLLVLSFPVIGSFIPWLQPYVAQGFENLGIMPTWYMSLVTMIYAATWGIRIWRRKSSIA